MSRMLAVVFVLMLCGCSAVPLPEEEASTRSVDRAPTVLAIVDAPPIEAQRAAIERAPLDGLAPSEATSEVRKGQWVSFRRGGSSQPAVEVPGLPTPAPITTTEIAVMPETLASIDVFEEASDTSATKITFERFDEFGQPRVFRVLDEDGAYFHVQVPMRPNGSTGWIRKSDVEVISTDQRIQIDLSDRSVIVWEGDEVVFDSLGTVGQETTPTPVGSFYVRNVFEWYPDSIYGPYVIPLSAYSEAIDQINGGDAVVAIHGTQRPDLVGAAASLGCVRLDNDTLRELAQIIEPGAPVDITS